MRAAEVFAVEAGRDGDHLALVFAGHLGRAGCALDRGDFADGNIAAGDGRGDQDIRQQLRGQRLAGVGQYDSDADRLLALLDLCRLDALQGGLDRLGDVVRRQAVALGFLRC